MAAELDSLRSRKSNIPLKSLEIRREMAEILGLEETQEIPSPVLSFTVRFFMLALEFETR